jgi:hypothetical protein
MEKLPSLQSVKMKKQRKTNSDTSHKYHKETKMKRKNIDHGHIIGIGYDFYEN